MWSAVTAPTVVDLLRDSCDQWPDRPLLTLEDGPTVLRRDMRELVEGFAGSLTGLVSAGERVAIVMQNRAEFLIAFLAVVAARGVVVPVNPESGSTDALHILRSSGAVVAIVDESGSAHVADRDALPDLREVVRVSGEEPLGLPTARSRLDLADTGCQPEDILAVTFTSGTTGLPKGCMIDHLWALRVTDVALRIHPYGPEDRIFYPVKFFYMDAPLALLRALRCGGSYVAARRFSVSRFWPMVRRHQVTILSTIASMPAWLLKEQPSSNDRDHSVRFAIQAQIAAELHVEMDARWGFPWLENYGMTEAGLIARVPLELADELRGTGSAGPPAPEVEVRIVDGGLVDVPAGRTGEILVRQPGMFRGYLGLPDATADLMERDWIRTGDLGRVDEHGYISVVGRIKDMIRRSGENVSAAEVEAILSLHPQILESAVIGVADSDHGEELKAYVRLAAGVDSDEITPEEFVRFCSEKLAPHKVPRYFEYVSDFARTPSMRIRKELLKASVDQRATAWDRLTGRWGGRE